ncbi:CDP-diacylglycerol--glycerol-3-phosphate 3-phosphatidyltransferase 1 [Canna indica]|uniref:CDP-diacylglycerol--glycerol-3-phosphate 3-phosphatidyltransferase 1 n=1 Tax=Canna indica TaxID=4628 RepID=A0AAQ3KCY1_9LILI|nr:CDP-diacylglycerol--glycerol-3-phosphate 3-phosphatidyltransferase 1 [Canna indica]
MAVFRTLIRSLLRNPNGRSHPSRFPFPPFPLAVFSSYPLSPTAAAGAPNSFTFVLQLTSPPLLLHSRLTPFSGPLFLSSPPWKLLQSATPFHLRGKDAIFPRDLLRVRTFPAGLGLRSLEDAEKSFRDVFVLREKATIGKEVSTVRVDDRFLNLPNLVSISRMVSGPLIGWMIINEWYLPAFGALVVSGATDWLDGFLARKMGINSVFGSYLDPLADKILISCVALAMVKKDLLSPMLVALVVFRDVGLVGGAVYRRASSLGWEVGLSQLCNKYFLF